MTKAGTLYKLFDYMPEAFRIEHWKNLKSSNKAYKKLDYKAVKVKIEPA
jgi:hypothetical protein